MQKLTSKKTIRKYDKDGKLLEEVVEETYTEDSDSTPVMPGPLTNPYPQTPSTTGGPFDQPTITGYLPTGWPSFDTALHTTLYP